MEIDHIESLYDNFYEFYALSTNTMNECKRSFSAHHQQLSVEYMLCFGNLDTNLSTIIIYFHSFHRFLCIECVKFKYWNNVSSISLFYQKKKILRKNTDRDMLRLYSQFSHITQHECRNFSYVHVYITLYRFALSIHSFVTITFRMM